MRYGIRTLLILLALIQPGVAVGKSTRHDHRELAKLRQAIKRPANVLAKPSAPSPWPGFQLDVF